MIDCEALLCKLTNHWMKGRDPSNYDYMGIIDTRGVIRYMLAKQQQRTGWRSCEVNGKSIFEYVNPQYAKSILLKLKEMATVNEPAEMEFKVKSKNGEWLGIHSQKIPIVSNDKIVGFIALCRKVNFSTLMNPHLIPSIYSLK